MEHETTDPNLLMTLQNSKRPEQVIHVVRDESSGYFETRGLRQLFGVDEIRVEASELAIAVTEYAQVLSFLMETMSAARDFGLPYAYQDVFEFSNVRYSLQGRDGYRFLKKLE
ncbi:MAG: hypothetical protein AB9873_06865 [Syntrophobacteraceae bacterium]